MAHLYAARAYDVSGKRDEAVAQYKEVLARPNVYRCARGSQEGLEAGVQGRSRDSERSRAIGAQCK
jgi:hypothetical protein